MKKYVLHPQWITSKNDGQRHYITAKQLAALYHVPMKECVIHHGPGTEGHPYWEGKCLHLFPRYNGNYDLDDLKESIFEKLAMQFLDENPMFDNPVSYDLLLVFLAWQKEKEKEK